MSRRADLLTLFLTGVTFLGCALLGLIGVGIAVLGLVFLVGGIHGGPLYAGIILLFGAALAFTAYYLAKLYAKSERDRASSADT